jgi:hypothetical protein
VADADVISAFWSSTTCGTLVHELRCDQPKTTKDLHDIATRHASGEEAVGTAFVLGHAKATTGDRRAPPSKGTIKGTGKGTKGDKKGQNCCP